MIGRSRKRTQPRISADGAFNRRKGWFETDALTLGYASLRPAQPYFGQWPFVRNNRESAEAAAERGLAVLGFSEYAWTVTILLQ